MNDMDSLYEPAEMAEILEALPEAVQKLEHIISLFGDMNGKRRTMRYLAKITADVIALNRLEKTICEIEERKTDYECKEH